MSDSSPSKPFAELVMRWFDGTASEADQEAMWSALMTDPAAAEEFARQARFEAMLKQQAAAESKAILELAALSCEMDDLDIPTPALVPLPSVQSARPVAVPVPQRAQMPWLRLAAAFVLFLGVAGLLCHFMEGRKVPQLAQGPEIGMTDVPGPALVSTITLIRPKEPGQLSVPATSAPLGEQLAALPERLDDFYLPEIDLEKVAFGDAVRWLTARLKEYNFLNRADFNSLTIAVPASAERRLVTLHCGPISFSKAMRIVSRLAQCDAEFTGTGVLLADRAAGNATPGWQPIPSQTSAAADSKLAAIKTDASSLGLTLPEQSLRVDPAGEVSVHASAAQTEALRLLEESRRQLAGMPPLAFMPVVLPAGKYGPDRVLNKDEVGRLQQLLQQAGAASPPVIVLPRTGQPVAQNNAGTPAGGKKRTGRQLPQLTITATPVGEMDRIRVDASPTVGTPLSAPPASSADGPMYAHNNPPGNGGSPSSYSDANGVEGYIDPVTGMLLTFVGGYSDGAALVAPGGNIYGPPAPSPGASNDTVDLPGTGTDPLTLGLLPVGGG